MADVLPWVLIISAALCALLLAAALARTLWVLVARARASESASNERNDA